TQEPNPPIFEPGPVEESWIVDPGLPASMHCGRVKLLVTTFQRYETAIANRLFRTLHELERLQRMRLGERLPAPVAVDVNVHADSQGFDSFSRAENCRGGLQR